jgi:hypothetical protein
MCRDNVQGGWITSKTISISDYIVNDELERISKEIPMAYEVPA